MTAEYSRTLVRHVWQAGAFRWQWEITDGIGGPVLHLGRAWTSGGAYVASDQALLDCTPSVALRIERTVDRLRREGLPVRVRVDERGRVCVTPRCVCTDRDHRRVVLAFGAIVGWVRWEVPA